MFDARSCKSCLAHKLHLVSQACRISHSHCNRNALGSAHVDLAFNYLALKERMYGLTINLKVKGLVGEQCVKWNVMFYIIWVLDGVKNRALKRILPVPLLYFTTDETSCSCTQWDSSLVSWNIWDDVCIAALWARLPNGPAWCQSCFEYSAMGGWPLEVFEETFLCLLHITPNPLCYHGLPATW